MTEHETEDRYLRKIIGRYAEHINLNEQKSILELKALVDPRHPTVAKLALAHPSQKQAFGFVSSLESIHVSLPVSFWLSFDEMVELSGGDPFDKSRLLCAMLSALGLKARVRVVMLESKVQHALVWVESQPVVAMDVVHGFEWSADSIDAALKAYPAEHKVAKSLYEFNHEEYRELEG